MNKKQLSKDTKAAKKQVSKPNAFSKDVIVTKRGQWDYPGQVTRIPGNQITMKNVPYPVLGIDDQGNQQMMFPGQDYVFPGSYVTEYPQLQLGGESEFIETELDDDQIAYYKSLGYRVEEVPTMQKGGYKTINKIPPVGSIKRKPYSMSPEEVWYSQHPEARIQGSLYNKPVRPIGTAPALPTATPSTTYTQKAIDKKTVDTPVRETQYLVPDESQSSTEDQINRAYWESVYNPTTLEQVGSAMRKPLQWMGDPFSLVGDVTSTIGVNPGLPTTDEMDIEHRKLINNPYLSGQDRFRLSMNEGAGLASNAVLNAIPFEEALWQGTKKIGKGLLPKGTTRYAEDYANEIFLEPHRVTEFPGFSLNKPANNFDLEELRRVFHNNERVLTREELNALRKQGYGAPADYRRNIQPLYDINLLEQDYINKINGLLPINYPNLSRTENISLQLSLNPRRFSDKSKILRNKSGLTKEEALIKVPSKDKDAISKMSETEFENTVLKPSGEIVPYHQGSLEPHFSGSQTITPLDRNEYINSFNEKIDLLNEIIAKRNKSGIEYRAKGLDDSGTLTFETPEQSIPKILTDREKTNIEWFNRDPEDFLTRKAGLKQEGNKWKLPDEAGGDEFNSMEEAIEWTKNELDTYTEPKIISGESVWNVGLQPGQWKGNVEDIANTEYFRSIPGLEMRNTTATVFADNVPRKGTGAYEAINEYLKELGLGRVKPGFNSQTDYSRGAWENFIKSGRGVGFYANPSTVYGVMKSVFPYVGAGYLGYKGLEGTDPSTGFGLREGWGKGQTQPTLKSGGEPFETEMSDDAIEYYRRLGYRIEEI